jgi:hypothetical protein
MGHTEIVTETRKGKVGFCEGVDVPPKRHKEKSVLI